MANIEERSKSPQWFDDATFIGVAKLTQVADKCSDQLSAVSLCMQAMLSERSQQSVNTVNKQTCPESYRIIGREPLEEWIKDDEGEGILSKVELRALRSQRTEARAQTADLDKYVNPHAYKTGGRLQETIEEVKNNKVVPSTFHSQSPSTFHSQRRGTLFSSSAKRRSDLSQLEEVLVDPFGKDKSPRDRSASNPHDPALPTSSSSGGAAPLGDTSPVENSLLAPAMNSLALLSNLADALQAPGEESKSTRLKSQRSSEVRAKPKGAFSGFLRAGIGRGGAVAFQEHYAVGPERLTPEEAFQLAHELDYPPDEITYIKRIFDRMDVKNKGLSADVLEKAVCHLLLGTSFSAAEVKIACKKFSRTELMGFQDFLRWFAQTDFHDSDQSTASLEEEAWQRQISQEGNREVKVLFDAIDINKSGIIGLPEFRLLLARMLHIPRGVEMPEVHVKRLWQDLDTNGNDKITLQEFLPWWQENQSRIIPYENLYANVRNLAEIEPDPPPYIESSLSAKLVASRNMKNATQYARID